MVTKRNENNKILTINSKGLFIDGKPTTTYNGFPIKDYEKFQRLLLLDVKFDEVQIMQASESELGQNPESDKNGLFTWARIREKSRDWSDWQPLSDYSILASKKGRAVAVRELSQNILYDALKYHYNFVEIVNHESPLWVDMSKIIDNINMDALLEADAKFLRQKFHTSKITQKHVQDYIRDRLRYRAHNGKKLLIDGDFYVFSTACPGWGERPDYDKAQPYRRVDSFCLNINYLEDFYKSIGLPLIFSLKPKDWKTAEELANKHIGADAIDIDEGLKKLENVLKGKIKLFISPDTGEIIPCLNEKAIEQFCVIEGLIPKTEVFKHGTKVIHTIREANGTTNGNQNKHSM